MFWRNYLKAMPDLNIMENLTQDVPVLHIHTNCKVYIKYQLSSVFGSLHFAYYVTQLTKEFKNSVNIKLNATN